MAPLPRPARGGCLLEDFRRSARGIDGLPATDVVDRRPRGAGRAPRRGPDRRRHRRDGRSQLRPSSSRRPARSRTRAGAAGVDDRGRLDPARRGGAVRPHHRRPARRAARAGHGLADGRFPADPHPRHGRGEPRLGVPGRRCPPAAAGGRRRRRGRVRRPWHPPDPGRGLLHRGEAQCAGRGRADRGGAGAPGLRSAAVLQGGDPQRNGHRRLGVRLRPAPRPEGGRHRHRLGGTDAAPGSGGRGVPGRRAGERRDVGVARRAAREPCPRLRGARRAATWAWNDLRKAA